MRRFFLLVVTLSLLVLSGLSIKPVHAEPPCFPGEICARIFGINALVAITPKVRFAWLRSAPNSSASIVYTITARGKFFLHPEKYYRARPDQGWVEVSLVPDSGVRGWVEYASLIEYPTTITNPPPSKLTGSQTYEEINQILATNWVDNHYAAAGQLAAGIPSASLRRLPGSTNVLATVLPSDTFVLLNSVVTHWDGTQWWFPVQVDTPKGIKSGWIEQNAVVVTYKSTASPQAVHCKNLSQANEICVTEDGLFQLSNR